jgi:predicted dehydrogenase/nucleoside-diphosphate-sugar epimerase
MHDIAIVGAGFIAKLHAEVLRGIPGVRLVAVCDTDRTRAESFARAWSVPNVFGAVDELIRSGTCTFAHVVVPPDLHAAVAEPLLRACIGVFVEKPMAVSVAECERLIATAADSGARLGVNHNATFHPAHADLARVVRAGRIGHVHHVIAWVNVPLRQLATRQLGAWMFRGTSNILFEQGAHPLSQIHDLAGPVRRAATLPSGRIELAPGTEFFDTWQVALECERATAQLFVSVGQEFASVRVLAIGEDGVAETDMSERRCVVQQRTRFPDFVTSLRNGLGAGAGLCWQSVRNVLSFGASLLRLRPRSDPFFVGIERSIRAFYRAVDTGGPWVDGRAGLEVVRMCELAAGAPGTGAAARRPGAAAANEPADVAVIGGTGFIGTRVVARLLENGQRVRVVARSIGLLPDVFHDPRVALVCGDIADAAAMRAATRDVGKVVHLAHGGGGDSWEAVERSMVGGTRNVAEACLANGVERLVYVGTIASLYLGDARSVVTGGTPNDPRSAERSLYSRGKAACDALVLSLCQERGLPACVLRPGVVVGAGTSPFHSGFGLMNQDGRCIGWNRGTNPLPLVLVDDVADAVVRALAAPDLVGRSYNVVGDVRLTAREYFAELREALGRPIRYHPQWPAWLQAVEIGKWLVKKAIGRKDAPFPSWRDLRSRGLVARFDCQDLAHATGWRPLADRAEFVRRAISCHRKARHGGAVAAPAAEQREPVEA